MDFDIPKNEPIVEKTKGEKTKVCQNCGKEGAMSNNFCEYCGNKFENGSNEKDANIKEAGEKLKDGLYKDGVIDVAKLIDSGDVQFEVEPGSKFKMESGGKSIEISSDRLVGVRISEGKYLNLVGGVLTVGDIEVAKKIADSEITANPDSLKDFKKTIDAQHISGQPLSELLDYVNKKYLSSEENAGEVGMDSHSEVFAGNSSAETNGAEALKESKNEAKKDIAEFIETMKVQHPEDAGMEIEIVGKETVDAIEGAQDQDFIDLALAKGLKTIREMVQAKAKKREEKRIEELRKKIENL